MATYQHNISQHCWLNICKLGPNDRNITAQHIATLLGATFWVRLTTLLRHVATCWVLKLELVRMPECNIVPRTWPNDHNIMQHPQHPHVATCTCCNMRTLHEKFDQFQIWANNTQHVATRRNRMAKRAQHAVPNNVAICCVEMLRSFGRCSS